MIIYKKYDKIIIFIYIKNMIIYKKYVITNINYKNYLNTYVLISL